MNEPDIDPKEVLDRKGRVVEAVAQLKAALGDDMTGLRVIVEDAVRIATLPRKDKAA
jgi:hypothetical protein